MDKQYKEILYPTLIACSYRNQRSLAIINQEIDLDILQKYLAQQIKDLPRLSDECDYGGENRSQGSESANSVQMDFLNGNNPYLPLYMRFQKSEWKAALAFFGAPAAGAE